MEAIAEMTSWILSVGVIAAGIYGLTKPEALVERRNQIMVKNGKPPASDADRPRHIRKAKMFAGFLLAGGIVILFCDIMLTFFI